jgi:hypothetical protein
VLNLTLGTLTGTSGIAVDGSLVGGMEKKA